MSTTGLLSEDITSKVENSAAPCIYDCSSLANISCSLSALHNRDTTVTSRLRTLVNSQADLSRELGRLDLLRAHLSAQVINTRDVSKGMLESAAGTASHLSSKVKELDLEKKRVEETLRVVEQVVELKACVQGVVGSMGAPQDWEAAAGYISRASKIPTNIVNGEFASRIIPNAEVPEAPGVVIENSKDSLCTLFLREFEKAAKEGDGSKVTRFFKLFPLIKKEDMGLHAYSKYICQGVAARARDSLREDPKCRDGLFFANRLTRLFEHIAQIIEGHGSLVERHYGKGMMTKVIGRLQLEVDVQGGIILDAWADERNIETKLKDVKKYPFSFLVQSFMPIQKTLGITRTSSPGLGVGMNSNLHEDEGSVDMKEVDGILNETAMMLGKWSLYSRFVAGKCRDSTSSSQNEPFVIPELLIRSTLNGKVSDRLATSFNIMTTFFFRRSVEKAFQLDESPSGLHLNHSKPLESNPPYITSAVDDIMYIVSTVIQRSLSTCQRDVISSVVPTIGRVLGSDFVGMIQRKMRDESYPKPMIQGGLPPEEKIVAFIILINSLEVANDYITRIITPHVKPPDTNTQNPLKEMFQFADDFKFVTACLENLNTSFTSQTMELHSDGLHVMFNQVIKPRFRPVLSDIFLDIDYLLGEDDLAELANEDGNSDSFQELVARRFEHSWEAIMKPIQRIMSPESFITLLDQTAKYLARVLEKRLWSFSGKINAFGALRMEKDFSGIIRIVSRGGRYGVRDSFARISQICMLANMEDEEWEAIQNGVEDGEDKMVWVLTEAEQRRARRFIQG